MKSKHYTIEALNKNKKTITLSIPYSSKYRKLVLASGSNYDDVTFSLDGCFIKEIINPYFPNGNSKCMNINLNSKKNIQKYLKLLSEEVLNITKKIKSCISCSYDSFNGENYIIRKTTKEEKKLIKKLLNEAEYEI